MAVDIRQIHIGSHVRIGGVRARVVRLTTVDYGHGDRWHILVRGVSPDDGIEREVGSFVDDDVVQPIPLTPALLEELGFKYHEYDNGKLWEWRFSDLYKAYGYLEFDESTTTIWRGHAWNMKEIEVEFRVEYLHELENIFYMIYEKELIPD